MTSGALPPLVEVATTTSTQEHARRLLQDGAGHGACVLAREQTAGRGRRGRTWLSGPHGLWMSLVVRRPLPMAQAPRLPLVAADVVAGVLAQRGVDARVKWPNDLLVPDANASSILGPFRKVGGLLVEAVDTGPVEGVDVALRSAIVGVGLNLRAPPGGFPDELRATAGALADVAHGFDAAREVDGDVDGYVDGDALDALRRDLAGTLQRALAEALPAWADDAAFDAVRARLSARSATLGRRVEVDGLGGTAIALADDGALLLRGDDGVLHTVRAGDVVVAGGIAAGADRAVLSSSAARR